VIRLAEHGVLVDDSGILALPPWRLTFVDQVENQLRTLPQPDFVFGYPFSATIRKPGEPAFLAISYAPAFDAIKACVLQAASDMAGSRRAWRPCEPVRCELLVRTRNAAANQ
jgi:hypothetical protein